MKPKQATQPPGLGAARRSQHEGRESSFPALHPPWHPPARAARLTHRVQAGDTRSRSSSRRRRRSKELSPGNLHFPAAKTERGKDLLGKRGDLGKVQSSSVPSLRAQHRSPCVCGCVRGVTGCASTCVPGEVAVRVSCTGVAERAPHTPAAFGSRGCPSQPPEGLGEPPAQEELTGNAAPAGASSSRCW